MPDIFEIMTLGEYADMKKVNSGNKITDHYHESTANSKIRDVYFDKSQKAKTGSGDGAWGSAIPPVLIPAGLTMEELMELRIHLTHEIFYDSNGVFVPSVGTVACVEDTGGHYSDRNLYTMQVANSSHEFLYDPETGVIFVRDNNDTIATNLAETLGYDANSPDYNKLFEYLYRIMIGYFGDVPRITIEAHDTEDQQVNAKITFSVPAKEFCNADFCIASYDIGASESQGYDSYSASEVYGPIGTIPGGDNIARNVRLGEAPFNVSVTINQYTDEPEVEIRFCSSGTMLYQADDEGKVFSTEAP